MYMSEYDVLQLVRTFRERVLDKSYASKDELEGYANRFAIKGEVANEKLLSLCSSVVSSNEKVYAVIDMTLSCEENAGLRRTRLIVITNSGVYFHVSADAPEKFKVEESEGDSDDVTVCDYSLKIGSDYLTWDDIGGAVDKDEYVKYISCGSGKNNPTIYLCRVSGKERGLCVYVNDSWCACRVLDVDRAYSAFKDFLLGLRKLGWSNSDCVAVADANVVSKYEGIVQSYLQSHKDLPPMDATSISDVCVHNVYHAKVSAKYLTRKWISIKGTSETEVDNVEGSDIWNVPGLGEEGDGVAILPNSEHMEPCTTCFGHGEHPCTSCHGTGRHECHHCHGEKKEECPECHGEKKTKCDECGGKGLVKCTRCGGTGYDRERCPACSNGKVEKTRWINCARCHGTGRLREYEHGAGDVHKCSTCDGRGQVKEYYRENCSNCHGTAYITTNRKCPSCDGTGRKKCGECDGTGRANCDECKGTGHISCEKCGGEGNVKCERCAGDTKKRFVCVDCFATGKMRHAIRVNQEQHDVGVNWCFSNGVPKALLPSVLPDWHREVIVNCSSSKTTVEDPHLSQGISPCLREAWEYIIATPTQTKKVRFQDQQVLLERSAYLVSCDYFSYGIAHKAWIDLHQMQVVMIDKQEADEVNKRDALGVGDSAKQEYACCSIKTLMDFDKGIKLYKEAKYKEAFPLLKAAADCGVVEAMSWTGIAYYDGHADISDGAKSKKSAFEWFKKATLAGSLSGAEKLGEAFRWGIGVERDDRKAYELFLNAYSRGYCEAELFLAYSYDDGQGVNEDKSLANKLYQRLASRGDSNALYYLGFNYLNGSGVVKNEQEAFRLISLSAERGNSNAKKKLKEMGLVDLQGQNLESGAVGVDFMGVDLPLDFGKPMSVEDILALPSGQSASDQKRMKGSQESGKGSKQKRKTSSVLYSYKKKRFMFFIIGLSLGWLGWHFRYAGRKNYFWVYWAAVITLLFAPRHSIVWNCCCLAIAWLWIGCTLFMRNDGDKRRMPWFK